MLMLLILIGHGTKPCTDKKTMLAATHGFLPGALERCVAGSIGVHRVLTICCLTYRIDRLLLAQPKAPLFFCFFNRQNGKLCHTGLMYACARDCAHVCADGTVCAGYTPRSLFRSVSFFFFFRLTSFAVARVRVCALVTRLCSLFLRCQDPRQWNASVKVGKDGCHDDAGKQSLRSGLSFSALRGKRLLETEEQGGISLLPVEWWILIKDRIHVAPYRGLMHFRPKLESDGKRRRA